MQYKLHVRIFMLNLAGSTLLVYLLFNQLMFFFFYSVLNIIFENAAVSDP